MNLLELLGLPHIPWWVWIIGVVVFVGLWLIFLFLSKTEEDALKYFNKKASIFDTKTEAGMYKILPELYGDKFYIFAQVNLTHFIEPNVSFDYRERMRLRSRIDRKSIDFLLCNKEHAAPQLVIELDGGSHSTPRRMDRDGLVDSMMAEAGMPILHLRADKLDKEFIKVEVDKALAGEQVAIS